MKNIFFTLVLISILNLISFTEGCNRKCKNYVRGVPAIGFQYNNGAAWAILCYNTPYGTVPGKRDGHGGVYYTFGAKEYRCGSKWKPIYGQLYHMYDGVPDDCKPLGYQTNDKKHYYNALVMGDHGMVPGKANMSKTMAWYPYGGKEHYVRAGFYIIC